MQLQVKSSVFLAFIVVFSLTVGCDKEFHSVGIDLFEDYGFKIQSETYPVYVYQDQVEKVQTNGLPLTMLGSYSHPVFGKTKAHFTSQLQINQSPFFGNYSQDREDEGDPSSPNVIPEDETVTEVFLEIPFFTNQNDADSDGVIDERDIDPSDPQSDTDGDGLSDLLETQAGTNPLNIDSDGDGINDAEDEDNESYDAGDNVYQVDSLYGNRNARFTLKVQELTYYLSQLDPADNFASSLPYYNDTDYAQQGFVGETLFEGTYELDFSEIPFYYDEDDPETEVDERTQVEGRLTPRIRVPLDPSFFQENLIDLEGSETLSDQANFQSHMKGVIIQADQFSEDLLMLLDINSASIKIQYDYNLYNDAGSSDDLTDDFTERDTQTFNLILGGVTFTTLTTENGNPAPASALLSGLQEQASEKIFVQGGRYFANVSLFGRTEQEQLEAIRPIKIERRLVNEANLRFFVSDLYESNPNLYLPERLYLYLSPSGDPLPDYAVDNTFTISGTNANKYILGGMLQYGDNGLPSHYKFTITENINTLLNKALIEDTTLSLSDFDNFSLGLVIGADINLVSTSEALLTEGRGAIKYPTAGVLNPFGVELWGNASEFPSAELEIIYNATR